MDPTSKKNTLKVIKFVQEILLDEIDPSEITPAIIDQGIDRVLTLKPRWSEGLDRAQVTDELIRRFSLWIGQDATLKSDEDHVAWLSVDRKRGWRYWQRYREWLELKLSWKAVDALDRSTDEILGLLEDPERDGSWDRRGLVVGHVQSGKTGNYTGLICKAADAGYKIIIVLAGLHNNLRAQTQMRLDEGFLGYETSPFRDEPKKIIGVGEIDSDSAIRPNFVTNRSERGDFNTALAKGLGISPEERPWLFVVKKNKTVLERLHRWIEDHVANTHDPATGRKLVTHLPLLVIDDEADHASVDTGEQFYDENGNPDPEHEPTKINRAIRRILHSFSRKAYVGYTATPFANIFIHEKNETKNEGPDLFPSAFIINLATPSNYIGPSKVFGMRDREDLLLVREVSDHMSDDGRSGWMPQGHKNGWRPFHPSEEGLPPSLVEAIDAFVLACAIRRIRGQGDQHCSMLVHVTRFNSVQNEVHSQIQEHVRKLRQRLTRRVDHESVLTRMKGLWTRDFAPTSAALCSTCLDLTVKFEETWSDIEPVLADAISEIDVRMINGTAKDALDYADSAGALKVIAIGGDKLARGLTLEGLCVSYFLRASRMYDTLMQMGRWFGYRPGYLDLCRLYTTSELTHWFGLITEAAEELREEFDLMAATGATPRDYGLKVQSHPTLLVTSRLKMRAAKDLMLSFSGELLETVVFHRNPEILERNFSAAQKLIALAGNPTESTLIIRDRESIKQKWTGFLWKNVPAHSVIDFLNSYQTHPDSYKVRSPLIAEFIESMNSVGELTDWTVAIIGGGDGDPCAFSDYAVIQMSQRTSNGKEDSGRYSIGRLLSPRDESIDLDKRAWQAALELTKAARKSDPLRGDTGKQFSDPEIPNGPAMRRIRGEGSDGIRHSRETGLLLLYALDPKKSGIDFADPTPPIIAFGISFPGSNAGKKVLYKVNSVQWRQWEQDYGSAD